MYGDVLFLFQMTEELKVFENLYDNITKFENKEEFQRYYNKNKENIDAIPTRGLNIKFKIEGYKLGRQKGQIMLYPLTSSKEDRLKILEDRLLQTTTLLNAINARLNKDMENINAKLRDLNARLLDIEDCED